MNEYIVLDIYIQSSNMILNEMVNSFIQILYSTVQKKFTTKNRQET